MRAGAIEGRSHRLDTQGKFLSACYVKSLWRQLIAVLHETLGTVVSIRLLQAPNLHEARKHA